MDSPKQTAKSFLQPYEDHEAIEGIMDALPRIEKFHAHANILNSLESRVEAYQGSNARSKELREALEMVYDEEVQRVSRPTGYFGVKCYLGNIFFPKAFLDTSSTFSWITFDVYMNLHKASMEWSKPRKIKHHGQDLKVYGVMRNYHIHIGNGFYLLDFMVIRHMNVHSPFAKHDLLLGSDLLFQASPKFNYSLEPYTLTSPKEIEVHYIEDGDFECDGKGFMVIPTSRKSTLAQRRLPKPKVQDIEEGEFLEGDYVESDGELEAYFNALIDEWVEDIPIVKRGSEKKRGDKSLDGVKDGKHQGVPLVILSSDDDASRDDADDESMEEGFGNYP